MVEGISPSMSVQSRCASPGSVEGMAVDSPFRCAWRGAQEWLDSGPFPGSTVGFVPLSAPTRAMLGGHVMAGITRRSFLEPDGSADFGEHGDGAAVEIGGEEVWRSRLLPGWSWDGDIKPHVGGLESCPMTHREYVVSGRMRYLMEDGTEIVAQPDDYLVIEPGHRAWVEGDEPCVLIDW